MSEQLRTMLHEVADDHPDLGLSGDPWRRGRRIRLARRVAGVAGAAATVTAVVAGTVLLTTPDLTSGPEPAQEDSVEPTLPNTLHEVPLNIPDITDDPLGEPAAVVYSGRVRTGLFSDSETRPLVVGAETGEVRAVREKGCCAPAVLSPDGTKLAVGLRWENWPESSYQGATEPPQVLIADLLTGDVETHMLPDEGLGGVVDDLVWDHDSSRIALTNDVITELAENGHESVWIPGWLDLATGEWDEHGLGVVRTISDDGQQMVADGSFRSDPTTGIVISDVDGSDAVNIGLGNRRDFVFSPDGGQVAAVIYPGGSFTQSDGYALEIFDAHTGKSVGQMELGDVSSVSLIGWGDRGVLVESSRLVPAADESGAIESLVERIGLTDMGDPERSTVLIDRSNSGRIAIPSAFLDADTREAEPPDAGFDWAAWVPDPYLLIMFGGVGGALVIGSLRRRARSARG